MRVALLLFFLLFTLVGASGPQLLYLKEYSTPSSAYKGSVFPIEVKLLVLEEGTLSSELSLQGLEALDENPKWRSQGDNLYSTTYLIKALSKDARTPAIDISLINQGVTLDTISLDSEDIDIIPVEVENFSGVFAQELKTDEFRSAIFDDSHNIMIFELNAQNSNLEDFHLKKYKKQGLESYKGDYYDSKLIYYVVVNKNIKEIEFKYFNTQKKRFEEIVFENKPTDERVSTQSDLKPKNTFLFTKIILSVSLVSLFVALFVFKRKKIFLLLALLVGVAMLFFLFEKGSVVVKKGAKIQILPTPNSTVFHTTTTSAEADLLAKKGQYIKIELDNKIGWIKRSDTKN
ncbi:MAG: hypothetical protein ACLFOC_01470 [Campylobacterales bacterium]